MTARKHQEQAPPPAITEGILPGSEADMMLAFDRWEQRLMAVDPRDADHEWGRIHERAMKIANMVQRRMFDKTRNRCGECNRPLGPRGPVDTISVADNGSATGWRNLFACSITCSEKLKAKAYAEGLRQFGSQEPSGV